MGGRMQAFVQRILAGLVAVVWLSGGQLSAQVLVVDQASGDTNELIQVFTQIPDNRIAQSFTPSLSAVGFVQFSEFVPGMPGNDQVTFMVNLRAGAYDGPILGSTEPVVLFRGPIQIGTFYYPANIPVMPGQLYFFEPVLLSPGSMDIGDKATSTYSGGEPWVNGGPSGPGDFWFREGIVVPEPCPVCFTLLGIAVLICHQRTCRKRDLCF